MNSYEKIYNMLIESSRGRRSLQGPQRTTWRNFEGDRPSPNYTRSRNRQTLKSLPGSAKPLDLPAERQAAPTAKTTTEPLLPSGEANPAFTAMIKKYTGKLSPEIIAAMRKRLSGSEENISTQHGGSVRQARGR